MDLAATRRRRRLLVTSRKIGIILVDAHSSIPAALVACAWIAVITIFGFIHAFSCTVIAIILCTFVVIVTAVWTSNVLALAIRRRAGWLFTG